MRQVYFSFHYEDVWRVNQIRNSGLLFGDKSVGFSDSSIWEEAKAKNSNVLRKLIRAGLTGTSVTAVLIGSKTSSRRWVTYEIEKSIERGNALIGVYIHKLRNQDGRCARQGPIPALLRKSGASIYTWTNAKDFGEWVEAAWQEKNKKTALFDNLAKFLGF
ncbi:TIR domain-containing protein [Myxococcus xanthus]|uniref:TIR domain-containing protein n=1 Tax=Myxococcus xanthus TaxID=34 RepID=UPI001128DEAC|nr:TIR domain-containing protein [Myxococcus xanthus]